MSIVSDIEIRLRADIARLQRDMTQARQSVDGALNRMGSTAAKLSSLFAGLGLGIGFGALAKQIVDAQREFDKLNSSLITATGSVGEAAEAFEALQAFAAETPYGVQEATEAFIKLKNLGLNPSEAALRSYGNTAAAMGKSLDQLIEAVADAATGEFERLKEFGIKAKQNGDQVSFTFKGITKTIGNNAKDIQAYLRAIGDVDFAGAMERRAKTLDGAISQLGDAWDAFLRKVATGGFGDGVLSVVLAISNALGDLGAIFDAVGGKAEKEGKKVEEAMGVHVILTKTFEALAVIGTNVAYIFNTIGKDIGAFAAQIDILFSGGIKGLIDGSTKQQVQDLGRARVAEAEQERKAVDEKSKAIVGAADAARVAQEEEAAERKKNGTDRLEQFEQVLTAQQRMDKALEDSLETRNRLNGVNTQTASDLKKLKEAYDTGGISLSQYNAFVAQVNKTALENSTAYKNQVKAIELSTEAIKRRGEAAQRAAEQEQQLLTFMQRTGQLGDEDFITKSAESELKALMASKDALQATIALEKKKSDSKKAVDALRDQSAQVDERIAARRLKEGQDLFELDQKRSREATQNTADLIEAASAETRSKQEQLLTQQDEIEALGMTEQQVAALTAARILDQAAALDKKAELSIIEEVSEAYRKQAEILRKQAGNTLYIQQLKDTQKFWGNVEQTAHDTFVSIADGGKDAFTRLKESAKNIFFEWLYQMTLKKWIINIGASVDGTAATSALASASGGSNLLSQAGSIGSLYNSITSLAAGNLGTGFLGSLTGGLAGAGAGSGLTSGLGLQIGNAIADTLGPQLAGALSTGIAGLATALPWVGGAVAVYSLAKAAFGRGPKQYSDNSTLNGMISTSGAFSGTLDTAYTQKGGWFRSDKNGVDKNAVDAAVSTGLADAYKAIQDTTKAYAGIIGLNADSIANRTQTISIALGKDEAANQQAIADFFIGVSDTIASEILPNIARFQQEGEGYAATLQRLAVDYKAVDVILSSLGVDSQMAFGAVGEASLDARERLIALAGGLDALTSQTQYFISNFLSKAEQVALIQKPLEQQLSALGFAGISTAEQFKEAVQGLLNSGAAATDAGAAQLSGLLDLAPQFKTVADYLKEISDAAAEMDAQAQAKATELLASRRQLEIQIMQLEGDAVGALAAQRQDELAAVDESLRALMERVYALQDEAGAAEAAAEAAEALIGVLRSAASTAFDALKRSVDAQKNTAKAAFDKLMEGIEASISAATSKVSDLQSLSQALASTNLPGTALDRSTAQAQIAGALALARAGGVLPKAEDIKDALSALSGDAADQFDSLIDYQRDQLLTANSIEELSGLTDDQLTLAQKTLAALQDQKTAAQAAYDAEINRLDGILARAQEQLDAINGVDNSIIGLTAAFTNFAAAIQAALGNKTIGSQPSVTGQTQIEALYNSLLGRTSDAGGLQFFLENLNAGKTTLEGISEAIKNSAEYQALHPPVVADTQGSGTISAKIAPEQQAINERMESSMARTASAVEQLASQFNYVSGGGNALLIET